MNHSFFSFCHRRYHSFLGPVACIVLYPILRMVSVPLYIFSRLIRSISISWINIVDFFYQHPPAPTFKARVVAATVGGSGIVVLMISNVGLVQVT